MSETPIMQQYHEAKKAHKECLLLFRLGDFYELFYDDAVVAAEILNITLTRRVQKTQEIAMSGFPQHTCDYYIAKLIKAGYKVAICEQVESANEKSSKIIKREVVRIVTQGTVVDDTLLEANRNNFLIALKDLGIDVSAAVLDLSTGEFFVEIVERQQLKEFLERTQPKEILLTQDWLQYNLLPDYDEWKKHITLIQNIDYETAVKKIQKQFNLHSVESIGEFEKSELVTIGLIIDYLNLTQKQVSRINLPKKYETSKYLQIDKFTRKNLEITKTLQGNAYGSVIWLLDETKTAQGARALFKTVNNPICEKIELEKRYDRIEFFHKNPILLKEIREILKEIPDFERLVSKIALGRAGPKELRILGKGIITFSKLQEKLGNEAYENVNLGKLLLDAIVEEAPSSIKECGYIKCGFDDELDSWRNFEENIIQEIELLQETYKQETKIATLRIKSHMSLGYVIEIPNSQKEKLGYQFTLKQELTSAVRYMSEKLDAINMKIMQSSENISKKEKFIFEKLCEKILEIADSINKAGSISAEIDLFSNNAYISLENNYTRPEITEEKNFLIKAGRHPVLEKINKKNGKEFVSNDCDLEKCVILMTGPNMAGKSTYLRAQALIALLAHIGMFIPAKFGKIGLIDRLFSRIGASDNLIEGNSTFMVEMIETALTLNLGTSKSFIIFDEVGRGTSTEEGFAIAQSILEFLLEKLKVRSLFATHYLDLHKVHHAQLQHKMMDIIEEPLHFTYKVIDGSATHSHAFAIAQLAGMPKEILIRAKELFLLHKQKNA